MSSWPLPKPSCSAITPSKSLLFRQCEERLPRHCEEPLPRHCEEPLPRHCEERSDVAVHGFMDCHASLAMTGSTLAMTGSTLAMTGSTFAMNSRFRHCEGAARGSPCSSHFVIASPHFLREALLSSSSRGLSFCVIASPHFLRHCEERSDVAVHLLYSNPGYKSLQSGLAFSINATFFARDPALSCFSRLMASYIVACCSK